MSEPTDVLSGTERDLDFEEQEAQVQRDAVAAVVRAARGDRDWSIEKAAEQAGVGRMTWRRVETGEPLRSSTYAKVDRVFEIPSGTTAAAANGGLEELDRMAKRLDVATPKVTPIEELLERGIDRRQEKGPAQSPRPTDLRLNTAVVEEIARHLAETVRLPKMTLPDEIGHLVSRLGRLPDRNSAISTAIQSLLDALPELPPDADGGRDAR